MIVSEKKAFFNMRFSLTNPLFCPDWTKEEDATLYLPQLCLGR